MSQTITVSSFLLSNLHCPSCVSYIQDTLYNLDPRPSSVSPSLVSSVVTVTHDIALSIQDIQDALENAGFEVIYGGGSTSASHQADVDEEIGYLDRFLSKAKSNSNLGTPHSQTTHLERHIENCESCRREALEGKNSLKPEHSTEAMQDGGEKAPPFVVVDSNKNEDLWRASLAVGGMTCAACVGAITEGLEKKYWVRRVVVNLISNSATVDFIGEAHKDEVVESIEDLGYDATLDSLDVVNTTGALKVESNERTVQIQVNGLFCDNCPARVREALSSYGNRIQVDEEFNFQHPIMKVTYTPQVPHFTIRHILQTISTVDPSFEVTIYHPPTLEERSDQIHRREQFRILIRVLLTLVIAIPSLIIGIIYMSLVPQHNPGRMYLMHPLAAGISRAQWALFILATPVYFLCADVFHIRALKEIRSMWRPGSSTPYLQRFYRFGSMNMLMSLGTSIAYISSVAQLIAAGVHPLLEPEDSSFYFDSVVFLTLFLLIGRLIESYSKSKTGDAVAMLGKLRPTTALLVSSGELTGEDENSNSADSNIEATQTVSVDLLEFGDTVRILHGGSPPCDGTIIRGESKFDESSLTGESKLVKKSVGDQVFSGTINKESPVTITISGVAGTSMLDQIVKAVREGQTRRAPMERLADTLTAYFVPFVTLCAISTWVIWLALGLSGTLPESYLRNASDGWVAWSLQFSIAVFVVACPCGLALAAPTALFVGGGLAAKHGILAKGGGEAFEKASKLECIVFDKTGTLTMGGEPVVTEYRVYDAEISKSEILGMVKSLEENSSHTVARAMATLCKTLDVMSIDCVEVEEVPGKGMKGSFVLSESRDRVELVIGNEAMISEKSLLTSDEAQQDLNRWKAQGRSVALAAHRLETSEATSSNSSSWELAAIFAISDPIRPEAPGIIRALQQRGTDVWMLSGDNQITANAIGSQVGIPSTNIIAGVLPSEKSEKIQYLQKSLKSRTSSGAEHSQKRALIAMVGDGINDSPALTTADVGIAIGSGSDIAISSAEFVLVSSNLNSLIILLDLSKVVFRRIKFNFAWALVYNMIALPVAAGVFYPLVSNGKHIRLDPVWASLAMAASSISVVCSSLALRSGWPGIGFRARRVDVGGD